ncbi:MULTISPECIES: ATP-binding protein [unclassified Burkholderia]|uniref:ATP-binding protein n=1 Tax=unclassified Burkholderia TaxID=2613784 RepID=UPI001421AB90|nr:AAA family ATPase [Burkholderia sp. Tr-860]NIF61306.1 AAA family ATPase [Burkholderia sp. Cy-647]NIF94511.1 AAA family ATPase [Burkholderia sp. Ax-1720]
MGRVIYLTGAPATGKSSICDAVSRRNTGVRVFSYSSMLRETVSSRTSTLLDAQQIRQNSAAVVTRDDVAATDERLIVEVEAARRTSHVVIDSHPVTKEIYGFRITGFTIEHLHVLKPDVIVCTYTSPEELERRIRSTSEGRVLPSFYDLDMHVKLQASVAIQYGLILGRPSYFLDTSSTLDVTVNHFLTITKLL